MAGTSVSIELGAQGKRERFELRYDMNAVAELEEALDVSIDGLYDLETTFRVTRAMLWAGLLHTHPSLTMRQAGSLIASTADVREVAKKCTEALVKSGLFVEGNGERPFPESDGTGTG